MRKILFACLLILSISAISAQEIYKDGTYTGKTQSIYKAEPFLGVSTIIIKDSKIESVNFYIIDTAANELFDEKYEKHYEGVNQEYVEQCRNDWKGIQRYPKVLKAKQKLEEVDAVSGATWSYNMFKDASKIALQKAKK